MIPFAALTTYKKLREKDVPAELAYMECWQEVKLIADTMIKIGPKAFFEAISPNALIGAHKATELFFDESYEKKLNSLADDIWSEKFNSEIDNASLDEMRTQLIAKFTDSDFLKTDEQLRESFNGH